MLKQSQKLRKTGGSLFRSSLLLFLALVWSTGCATYQYKVGGARGHLRDGQPDEAAKLLEPLALEESDDQLVYLLDYGAALQQAGRYDESIKVLLKAAELAEVQDYHSLSRVTGSLLLSEGMVQYKGEDYEKLLIHVYLALNFLMKNDLDGALIETRRLDQKLNKYRIEAKRDYEQNAFARYLNALIWESDRKWDDAYIDYKTIRSLDSNIAIIQKDLIRTSLLARRNEDHQEWKKTFRDEKIENWWKDPDYGEIVLIYLQGQAPIKRPHPDAPRFPKLNKVPSYTRFARLHVSGVGDAVSEPIYSVQNVAIKTLEDAYAPLVAKRMAGIIAKHAVAKEIEKKDSLLGAIAWISMNAADQADLRQWSTLPETFQIARIPVKKGKYKIRASGLDANQVETSDALQEREVQVDARKKTFVLWRSYQ